MTDIKLKVYPSASGFTMGRGIIVDYNSGCPRYLAISQNKIRKDINPMYGELGLFHENKHAAELGFNMEAREVPFSFEIEPGVMFSGRCDFLTRDNGIDETKASVSKSFLYGVVRKKKYKISHLAQIVAYMMHFKRAHGRIITGFYDLSKSRLGHNIFTFKEGRDFKVTLSEEGSILVDGEDSGYTVGDQYKHTLASSEALKTRKIFDRPINHIEFNGPCTFCPLKNHCDKYDKGIITESELLESGEKLLKGENDGNAKV